VTPSWYLDLIVFTPFGLGGKPERTKGANAKVKSCDSILRLCGRITILSLGSEDYLYIFEVLQRSPDKKVAAKQAAHFARHGSVSGRSDVLTPRRPHIGVTFQRA
jgi:hypothetical protein